MESEVGCWLRCFFGLPFLPYSEVYDAFTMLVSDVPSTDLTFPDFIYDNYIREHASFPPNIWAAKPTEDPRTTNGAEAFHSHFNAQFYSPHPNIHKVIDVLLSLQAETKLKLISISNNI